ncbi:MAG: type 4a pilus biogenesis protein PilO [Phycisphaerae bacterium]|nr:type 4a pilus biogenesis protein PilO [Phycisphaerae bacterium]
MKVGFREFLFLILLLAIPALSYGWVFRKANDNWQQHQKDMQLKQQKLADLKNASKGIDDLNKQVTELTEAVAFFERKLPAEHEMDKVLSQVSQIAEKFHLETRQFKILKPEPFADYCELPIEMGFYGDFADYYKFQLELEKLPRLTKITKMNLVKDKNNDGITEIFLELRIFFDTQLVLVK